MRLASSGPKILIKIEPDTLSLDAEESPKALGSSENRKIKNPKETLIN